MLGGKNVYSDRGSLRSRLTNPPVACFPPGPAAAAVRAAAARVVGCAACADDGRAPVAACYAEVTDTPALAAKSQPLPLLVPEGDSRVTHRESLGRRAAWPGEQNAGRSAACCPGHQDNAMRDHGRISASGGRGGGGEETDSSFDRHKGNNTSLTTPTHVVPGETEGGGGGAHANVLFLPSNGYGESV